MDDSCQSEKRKLDKRDILDAVLTTISLLALLWWMGWFPFNGFLDDLLGKKQQAQSAQASVQPAQGVPPQRIVAPPASFEEIAKACVVLCSVTDKKPRADRVCLSESARKERSLGYSC